MSRKARLLIVGGGGSLSTRVNAHLTATGAADVVCLARKELDVSDAAALAAALDAHRPDYVLNGAAFLNADRCEGDPASSYAINYLAARTLGHLVAAREGMKLIHISTDFVFDGKTGNYDESAYPCPLAYYGLHKYMADCALQAANVPGYILRVASVVGAGAQHKDLVKTLLRAVASGRQQLAVNDEFQISVATNQFIAEVIAAFMAKQPAFGLYNCVGKGIASWCALARAAFDELGVKVQIDGAPASAYPLPAARPVKSFMLTGKLESVIEVPHWEALVRTQVRLLRDSYQMALDGK